MLRILAMTKTAAQIMNYHEDKPIYNDALSRSHCEKIRKDFRGNSQIYKPKTLSLQDLTRSRRDNLKMGFSIKL